MMAKHSKLLSGLSKATNAFNKSLAKKLLGKNTDNLSNDDNFY